MPTHNQKKMKTVYGKTCARLERKVDGKRKQGRGGGSRGSRSTTKSFDIKEAMMGRREGVRACVSRVAATPLAGLPMPDSISGQEEPSFVYCQVSARCPPSLDDPWRLRISPTPNQKKINKPHTHMQHVSSHLPHTHTCRATGAGCPPSSK